MRLTIRAKTLGGHTHLGVWVNGGKIADDMCLRNDELPAFLDRLRPEELTDETPEGHEPVAAQWANARSLASLATMRRALKDARR